MPSLIPNKACVSPYPLFCLVLGKLLPTPSPSTALILRTGKPSLPRPHFLSQTSFFTPISTFSHFLKAWHTHITSPRRPPHPPAEVLFQMPHSLSPSSKSPKYSFLSYECSQVLNIHCAPRAEPGSHPSHHTRFSREPLRWAHFTDEEIEPQGNHVTH